MTPLVDCVHNAPAAATIACTQQTYTYAVEPVRANTRTEDAEGPGASMSVHDSIHGGHADKDNNGDQDKEAGPGPEHGAGSSAALSWEVRLIQELCDLGSLRDAIKNNTFRCGCVAWVRVLFEGRVVRGGSPGRMVATAVLCAGE